MTGWAQGVVAVTAGQAIPEAGQLVRVRGQHWVVTGVHRSRLPEDELAAVRSSGRTLVTLSNVSDDAGLGQELRLIWEIEPGRDIVPATQLPAVTEEGWDEPRQLGAFLDAVRWGTVASADIETLQAPFRSGITIEEYQLEPVARALAMPRVNLLIADDVGLGKTIEAGLIAQEMLLRHRIRRIVVVCPAPLTIKWREEMSHRFGLDFAILNADALRELRRTHGLQANSFTVYPRTIISLPWLRTPRVQRLLDEVLPSTDWHAPFFDLLIVDEAHHCAPPAPTRGGGYAVDSLQTMAVRRMGQHSQHRLFLSATPHNGYSESWQALLEMLDPQRFARGVAPEKSAVDAIMVRRLKDDITKEDGTPRFPGRRTEAIEVRYTDEERRGHALLSGYVAHRRTPTDRDERSRGNDLVSLLLKKRLFSSPAAFASTLTAHVATLDAAEGQQQSSRARYDDMLDWDDALADDETRADAERELLTRVALEDGGPDAAATDTLDQLQSWAERYAAPADSKATTLIDYLRGVCTPDGDWNAERVIVFTEYVDTLTWLVGLLEAHGLGGNRVGVLRGGMEDKRREHLKAAFQATPDRHPIRILLATDAASEGIDLQRHCHRIVHYDIPFNPNRLEQRIGRVDRHGQHEEVQVSHFVGAGWQSAAKGSYEDDLEFLSRVARKVATEREDLGSVNPVLAKAVEDKMLGRVVWVDPTAVKASPAARSLHAERTLRTEGARIRDQLAASRQSLHVHPANVRRVLDVALDLAGQPALVDSHATGEIEPPNLRGGWERTTADHDDPLSGTPRPFTVDSAVSADRDDIVLAHLEHPLVAQATRLLRSAIWGGSPSLHRVAVVRADLPPGTDVDGPLVAVFSRLVVVGTDGARLHEEVMLTGRVLAATEGGRSRRLELEQPRNAGVRRAVEAALDPAGCRAATTEQQHRLAREWPVLSGALANDVTHRAGQRLEILRRQLESRAVDEVRRITGVFDQLETMLAGALGGEGIRQLSFADLDVDERQQVDRDRVAWQARLDDLPAERERELQASAARYAGMRQLVFPFAVALVVP